LASLRDEYSGSGYGAAGVGVQVPPRIRARPEVFSCSVARCDRLRLSSPPSEHYPRRMPDRLAELTVSFVHPDGRRVPGRIWIGQPSQLDEVEAQCPVRLDGLHEKLVPVAGNDTLQAMLLAVRLLASLLGDFQERGGRVLTRDTGEPLDLESYFGALLRPAAFLESDLDWHRPDVTGIITSAGMMTVAPDDHQKVRGWLRSRGYGFVSVDCARGQREVRQQLGDHLHWVDQFGYRLEEGEGSLDALRDGFDFEVPQPGGVVLELLEAEVVWREQPLWFEGLLGIASEHSRYHLALGRRFMTLLVIGRESPLVGRIFETLGIPYPESPPGP
jgi:hypothetical protein